MTFGQKIKKIRNQRNMKLHEVADALGIQLSYLSNVENAHKPPFNPETLQKFSDLMGLASAELEGLQALAVQDRDVVEISTKKAGPKLANFTYHLARAIESGFGDDELADALNEVLEKRKKDK